MLAVTFLFPAVLWAACAAAAPVIIHLILRTKPRKIIFPALQFVRKTHQANISKLKLKHLILLAMRMDVLVLLALLIARGQLPRWKAVRAQSSPVSAVIIVDNSASMGYRHNGQTLLSQAKQMADSIINSLPEGSQVAVLSSDNPMGAPNLLSDRKLVAKQVADMPNTASGRSLAESISRALALLAGRAENSPHVYILTDMTTPAWRDAMPAKPPDDIPFTILDVGQAQETNVCLGDLKISSQSISVGATTQIETFLTSSNVGGQFNVQTELDGQVLDQQTVQLTAGSSAYITTLVQPQREGFANGRVLVQAGDPLEVDNVKYFSLNVGPQVRMLILCDRITDATFRRASSAANPPMKENKSWISAEVMTAGSFTKDKLAGARIAMLTNVSSLSDAQWQALEDFAQAGGHVWIIPGANLSPQAYNAAPAQKIMPLTIKSMEELSSAVNWQGPSPGQEMLEPFLGDDNPPLTDVACRRRFIVAATSSETQTILKFQDNVPAILSRPIGQGSVIFWNFCCDAESLDASMMPQFVVLTQRTLRLLARQGSLPTAYTYGQPVNVPLPKAISNPVTTVLRPGAAAEEPLVPDYRSGQVSLTSDRLGHWRISFVDDGRRQDIGYSVNVDTQELNLTPLSQNKVLEMFHDGQAIIAKSLQDISRQEQIVNQPLDLVVPILLALLAMMIGESYFANRFYKRTNAPVDG